MDNKPSLVFGVSDFIAVVNQTFEYAYSNVEVEGEVSSFKINQGKFVFFDIKDDSGLINCFMMTFQLRVPIEDGMKVIVSAMPKLTNKGKFSLTVKSIRPSGEGAIKKSAELLKAKLDEEGLFAPERKRPLPTEPHHIAVITSVQAAGYADFMNILDSRWGGMKIDVANVQVQGEGAADQIVNAINYINGQEILPEIIVIVRGGGSADDLSVFNDELLVRAVAGSRIPTVVGVGHEIDKSLADLAADVSAITPTNAAQIIVPDKNEIIRSVRFKVRSILPFVENIIDRQLINVKSLLGKALARMSSGIDLQIEKLNGIHRILDQLNPSAVLNKGYALVRGLQEVGQIIEIETSKNIMKAEVKDVRRK